MAKYRKKEWKRKTKIIRFLVTDDEHKKYNLCKDRLSIHSPTLAPSKIFREVAKHIDDKALIMFFQLDILSPIRTQLIQDFNIMFGDNLESKK